MEWIFSSLQWYVYLLVLGLVFFPFTRKLFSGFFDEGYAFSKTIAILVLSYTAFLTGILKITAFTRFNLILILVFFAALSLILFLKQKRSSFPREKVFIFLFEELLFLASLIFLTFIRGQEPSIRGLEKFMDFGFINSILRSGYFPPLDIWLSADPANPQGYPLNYYYFGHLTGAFLIKFTGTLPAVGYNFILATILAQSMVTVFSIVGNIVAFIQKNVLKHPHLNYKHIFIYGLIASFIVNFGGNLHTIYLFTKGYPNESPVPFWEILSTYNPLKYWYPNATRFIPFTIHEFPSYSYVVADLHGHVFDIPFVLLTLALLFMFFMRFYQLEKQNLRSLFFMVMLGFLTAVHYMTNAFDGPIYLLLTSLILFIIFKISRNFILHMGVLFASFAIFSLPFSKFFSPFVTGIGVNCSPEFLLKIKKIGPFLFEKGNCQVSAPWMLFILWGFFWISLLIFIFTLFMKKKRSLLKIDTFIFILFAFGTFLVIIPEFFYIKDIYPVHFRANTMFKLGYQAFMMMGIASAYVLYRSKLLDLKRRFFTQGILLFFLFFVFVYPFFAFPSYYGNLKQKPQLDGSKWINASYEEDAEIINYLNTRVTGQPVILEAQGDSYTDYERISAFTGLPTIAGWWVHEWLWRGSSDVVGKRIPDIVNIYESEDKELTLNLLKKYRVKYVVIATLERNKYRKLNENKFNEIARKVFSTGNRLGALYQVK